MTFRIIALAALVFAIHLPQADKAVAADGSWRCTTPTNCNWYFDGEASMDDGFFIEAIMVADAWWARPENGGRVVAGQPRIYWIDEEKVRGRAEVTGNKVWFERSWGRGIRARLARGGMVMAKAMAEACTVAAHERGHNHGFVHNEDPTSLMFGHGVRIFVPACEEWAYRRLIELRCQNARIRKRTARTDRSRRVARARISEYCA